MFSVRGIKTKTDMHKKDAEKQFDEMMRHLLPQDDAQRELEAAAFEVLLLNPGVERSDWMQILVEQYGIEVVDAYGNNPLVVFPALEDLWEAQYYDENSQQERAFFEWAQAFSTEESVSMYYDLIG